MERLFKGYMYIKAMYNLMDGGMILASYCKIKGHSPCVCLWERLCASHDLQTRDLSLLGRISDP